MYVHMYINDWPEQSNEWFSWLHQRKANQIVWGLLFSSCAIVEFLLGSYVVVLNSIHISFLLGCDTFGFGETFRFSKTFKQVLFLV